MRWSPAALQRLFATLLQRKRPKKSVISAYLVDSYGRRKIATAGGRSSADGQIGAGKPSSAAFQFAAGHVSSPTSKTMGVTVNVSSQSFVSNSGLRKSTSTMKRLSWPSSARERLCTSSNR